MVTYERSYWFFPQRCNLRLKEPDQDISIGLSGGESLLENKNIFKTIEYIKNKCGDFFSRIRFSLATNRILLTEEIIHKEEIVLFQYI